MAAEPLNKRPLTDQMLFDAKANYEDTWKRVDTELYELCRRRHHANFDDVFTKVTIVGRVYMAPVYRSWAGKRDPDHEPEAEAAQVLIEQAGRIQEGLQRLEGHPFNRQAARKIVELHRDVTEAISHRSAHSLTSFVSKYLHFHSPIVPIFDSEADAAISQRVHRGGERVQEALKALPDDGIAEYRSFVAAFVVLYERACEETNLKPTVKELDHLLWRQRSIETAGTAPGLKQKRW